MHQPPESAFNFEEWALLAKSDPQAFEAKREEAIAAMIAGAPPRVQVRLHGLQWKIDAERSLASNPLSACMRIFNQMWTSVYGEGGLLEALHSLEGPPLPERSPGIVLQLHQRQDQARSELSN